MLQTLLSRYIYASHHVKHVSTLSNKSVLCKTNADQDQHLPNYGDTGCSEIRSFSVTTATEMIQSCRTEGDMDGRIKGFWPRKYFAKLEIHR